MATNDRRRCLSKSLRIKSRKSNLEKSHTFLNIPRNSTQNTAEWGFPIHRGTPSYHLFLDGIVHEINHLFWGFPIHGNPQIMANPWFLVPSQWCTRGPPVRSSSQVSCRTGSRVRSPRMFPPRGLRKHPGWWSGSWPLGQLVVIMKYAMVCGIVCGMIYGISIFFWTFNRRKQTVYPSLRATPCGRSLRRTRRSVTFLAVPCATTGETLCDKYPKANWGAFSSFLFRGDIAWRMWKKY